MSDANWYAHIQGKQYGPVDLETFRAWVSEGRIIEDTPVWHPGISGWRTAHELPQLQDLLGTTTTPTAEDVVAHEEKSIPNRETEANPVPPEEEYEKTIVAPSPFLAEMLRRDHGDDVETEDAEESLSEEADAQVDEVPLSETQPEPGPEIPSESSEEAKTKADNEATIEGPIEEEDATRVEPMTTSDAQSSEDEPPSNQDDDEATRVMGTDEIISTVGDGDETVTEQDVINPFASELETVLERSDLAKVGSAEDNPHVHDSTRDTTNEGPLDMPQMNAQPSTRNPPRPPEDYPAVAEERPAQSGTRPSKALATTGGIISIVIGALYLFSGIYLLINTGPRIFGSELTVPLTSLLGGVLFMVFGIFALRGSPAFCWVSAIVNVIWGAVALVMVIAEVHELLLSQGAAVAIGGLTESKDFALAMAYLVPGLLLISGILILCGIGQAKRYQAYKRSLP